MEPRRDRDWDAFMRRVHAVEARPENQPGSDKTWIERLVAASREHLRRAIRVR